MVVYTLGVCRLDRRAMVFENVHALIGRNRRCRALLAWVIQELLLLTLFPKNMAQH